MSGHKQKTKEVTASPKMSKQELRQKEQAEQQRSKRSDMAKLALAAILLLAGVWGYYAQPQWSVYLRALFPLAGVILAVVIVFFWCDLGRNLVRYVKGSITEVKKVVWPTKNETWRNTLFVLVFTALMTFFLWVVDSILAWLFLLNA